MTLPNFIILGAAKAGTTALYHYLRQHPRIYLSPLKETNFFALEGETLRFCGPGDHDYVNCLSITTLEGYQAQFDGVAGETAIGEASPLYLYSPKAVERIRHYVPDARLIAFVRDPVDRAFSAFLHLVRDNREPYREFRDGLAAEEERIRAGWEHIWHYKRMGLYHEQLRRYYDAFPAERIRVFLYKDLRREPRRTLEEIFRFLEVDPDFVPDTRERYNVTTDLPPEKRPALRPEVRAELRAYFREDTLRLQDLIGRDLSHWLAEEPARAEAVTEDDPGAA
jgi:sulfotransferase family protein